MIFKQRLGLDPSTYKCQVTLFEGECEQGSYMNLALYRIDGFPFHLKLAARFVSYAESLLLPDGLIL